MPHHYDAIIIGAGPAGSTCALYAAKHGLNILLLDKKGFPRDKICGDAISGKSVKYLRELGLLGELRQVPQVLVRGVVFSAPNGSQTTIPFTPPNAERDSYGYVCRREVFDHLLFRHASAQVEAVQHFAVREILQEDGRVYGVRGRDRNGAEKTFAANVVIGADGFHSIISRQLGFYALDPKHHVTATRAYYRGISGLTPAIEIHFVRDILPGYFWIFPLEDGLANVGLGMRHDFIKKRGISLREAHMAATRAPFFRERFRDAELIGGIHGWNLPVGSKQRRVHGDGFLLIGDAAGLIDPFSGEGIGNAMCSAQIAAEVLAESCGAGDFSADGLRAYSERLWQTLGPELQTSYALQRLGRFQPLLNLVVSRAAAHREIREWISAMMAGTAPRELLTSPKTYLRLLFQPQKLKLAG